MLDWTVFGFTILALLVLLGGFLVVRRLPKSVAGVPWGLESIGDRFSRSRTLIASVLSLLLLGVVLVITAFTTPSPRLDNTVQLPIEVYPADGTSQTTESVTLNASNGSSADRLYFQMHQPFYNRGGWETSVGAGFDPETMVDVRINGGSWVTVRDQNVNCAYPERKYGCVGGTYSTIRFSMDASALGGAVDGQNVVEFRFNGTEGVRSGFRVLKIGFMRSSDDVDSFEPLPGSDATESLIDGTSFTMWSPASWSPPSGHDNSQSISDGEALWKAENSIVDLDGTPIVAGCASCHATDGRDLQYFAYSNKTITARSQAHGLSETEGKKIAAYIRSLNFTKSDGGSVETNSPGRPWDPPYQPGPTGFGPDGNQHPDEADPFYWAAGAGLEWVLDQQTDVTQYAFPASGDPANPAGIKLTAEGSLPWSRYKLADESEWGTGNLDRGTAVNMREIPLSVQLPDWNNWLPDIHPHDGMEKLFDGSNTEDLFESGESTFSSGDYGSIEVFLDKANGYVYNDIKSTVKDENDSSIGTSNSLTGPQWESAITSVYQWRATKIWYLQHEYNVEDKADDYYCDGSENEWCEPLGWLGSVRTVFDMAPHVSGVGSDAPYVYGTKARNDFYSHVWYQLQMVVNPGTAGSTGQLPTDEGYQENYIEASCNHYDVPCGIRQTLSEWKFWQIMSNDIQGQEGPIPGNLALDRLLNVVKTGDRKNKYWDAMTETPEGKRHARLWLEGIFRAVNAYMVGENGNEGRIATVERVSGSELDNRGFKWNGIGYDPTPSTSPDDKDYTSQLYSALAGRLWDQEEPLQDFFPNMSRGALDSLAAQGDLLSPDDRDDGYAGEVVNGWPSQKRWHDLVDYSGEENTGAPSVTITNPSEGASFTAPVSISLAADASDSDGSISKVTFYVGNTQIAEATSAPYETTWDAEAAGNYTLSAKATDDSGITRSSSVNITVSAPTSENNGLSYSYYEGDWTQLPDFGGLTAVTTGTTSGFDLSVRERDDQFGLQFVGYIDVPSSDAGTHTFYTTSDDGSRLVIDGQEIVNNDGVHAPEEASGTVDLSAGWHTITVEFFEQDGGEELTVRWETPTLSKQVIPDNRLFQSAAAGTSQEITLTPGWNLISSRIAPSDDNINTVFSDVESALVVVQNQQGDRYDPAAATNSLETWDSSQGYRVYMSGDQTLRVEGGALSATTLDLTEGWNLIPFYPTTGMSVEDAFASISGTVEMVKDAAGRSYIPGRNLDEIGTLKPGEAYKVYVNEATSFSYP
jgi:cytochrome c553